MDAAARHELHTALAGTIGERPAVVLMDALDKHVTKDDLREELDRLRHEIDLRFAVVDQRFEAIEQRITAVEQRLDRLEAEVRSLRNEITGLRNDILAEFRHFHRTFVRDMLGFFVAMQSATFLVARYVA